MKKLFLFIVLAIGVTFSVSAQQISKNALGLRLGDSDGFGAEISYQRGLTDNNRLEFGLGWRDGDDFNAFRLSGLYQWVFPLDGNFNWYVGAGGGIGNVDFDDDFIGSDDSETFVFIAGDIGIEYNFEIPLLISLDFRPEIGFSDFNDDLDFDIALGIRYQF
ncbi:outer membrane beta-barrel protein [Leptobacterium flavescens]|uniref:Outer membrane beta-barrel protein n=1 Tax=Leptobacterium flavescens TaxID=472055 RepID=A0A6P0UNE4_9FLAO|nr:outer membrane beta-barrel protein [Leptobacterium flavescens]NER13408.1 outer membrane beta-barrel protein [Leptobacterium flavescens]